MADTSVTTSLSLLTSLAESIFNREATSDLILVVNGHPFYVHELVLAQHSQYVKQMLNSPIRPTCADFEKPTINIDLPDWGFSGFDRVLEVFTTYLRILYGLLTLSPEDIAMVKGVAIIADFMITTMVLDMCDEILCKEKCHIMSLIFAQDHNLPKTLKANLCDVGGGITSIWAHYNISYLYDISPNHFIEIVRLCSADLWEVLGAITHYTSRDGRPSDRTLRVIKGTQMVDIFKKCIEAVSPKWTREFLRDFMLSVPSFRLIDDDGERDADFLWRIVVERLEELLEIECDQKAAPPANPRT